jgi:hypothetical protein
MPIDVGSIGSQIEGRGSRFRKVRKEQGPLAGTGTHLE